LAEYKVITVGELEVNCYLIYSNGSGKCFIVDPGDESGKIINAVNELDLNPEAVILTHAHIDHCGGISSVLSEFNIPLLMHKEDLPVLNSSINKEISEALGLQMSPQPDKYFSDGEAIKCDGITIKIIHTPGHTPGSVCLKVDGLLFTGDTLFAGSIGRTDLPGGDFKTIQSSLDKLRALPPEIIILPGHGNSTTLKREIDFNPFM